MVAFGERRSRRVAGVAFAAIVFAAPFSAAAVGLGTITQQSALGQSLRLVVPVTLSENEDIPGECFRIASGTGTADGVPELLFGRVNVERSASGTTLVITSSRPIHDPVVRLTLQAGCETSVRREYTLFMDPPAIDAPVVAAAPSSREVLGKRPPEPAATGARRAAKPSAQPRTRTVTRAALASADAAAQDKDAGAKARAATSRTAPRPPSQSAARPHLSVSSGGPGPLAGSLATEADRERARQEHANQIEAETAVLRQRVVELTAIVERMQTELRRQDAADLAAAGQAAKAAEVSDASATYAAKATAAVAGGVAAAQYRSRSRHG